MAKTPSAYGAMADRNTAARTKPMTSCGSGERMAREQPVEHGPDDPPAARGIHTEREHLQRESHRIEARCRDRRHRRAQQPAHDVVERRDADREGDAEEERIRTGRKSRRQDGARGPREVEHERERQHEPHAGHLQHGSTVVAREQVRKVEFEPGREHQQTEANVAQDRNRRRRFRPEQSSGSVRPLRAEQREAEQQPHHDFTHDPGLSDTDGGMPREARAADDHHELREDEQQQFLLPVHANGLQCGHGDPARPDPRALAQRHH